MRDATASRIGLSHVSLKIEEVRVFPLHSNEEAARRGLVLETNPGLELSIETCLRSTVKL